MTKPARNATHFIDWRQKPLARAIALATTALLASSLHAAPPAPLPVPASVQRAMNLPVASQNWLVNGTATLNTNGNTMTIDQATAKAILDWESFNIAKGNKVQFNQPSANASTLNRIGDNQMSQIAGQLAANGNVYLVNNNGILFLDGASVNVHGLVASTLNIDSNLYINSSLPNAINDNKAALEGGTAAGAAIVVAPGAAIATDEGGQVILAAPIPVNAGTIATPGGQTILVGANDKVYLAVSDNNPDLRGLLVEVNTGGNVFNLGKIIAERGNITLLGLAVTQSGVARATTSVDVNGSIRLLARDKATLVSGSGSDTLVKQSLLADDRAHLPTGSVQAIAHEGGAVILGKNSVTEVGLAADSASASDAQTQTTSRIDLMGKTIELQDNSTVRAKGGRVNAVATATPDNLDDKTVARNDSRIYVGANATVDVSGVQTELDMSARVVSVSLRADELKDSPLQRDGILHGETVQIDLDKGSPLIADMDPIRAKVLHTVGERLAAAGTINMKSQGDVVMGDQAHLDISGGSVSYKSGWINTTKLLSGYNIVDIGNADPNRKYDAVFGKYEDVDKKWGKTVYVSRSFATYREGFTVGNSAGALNIDTQSMYGFDRVDLQAGANTGLFQRAGQTLPQRGAVSIALGQGPSALANSAQDVVIRNIANSVVLPADGSYLDKDSLQPLSISAAQLNNSGLGKFTLTANGVISQTADAAIALKPGASIALNGTGIKFDGSISAPGGSIALTAKAPSDDGDYLDDRFNAVLSATSSLDTSGSWVNDLFDGIKSTPNVTAAVVNGGAISVSARNDLTFARGATLRSDAGAQLTSTGARVTGKGGTISLASLEAGSQLTMLGTVSAFGFSGGGTLNLSAPSVDIGATPSIGSLDSLWLGNDVFTHSGFSQYNVTASAGALNVHADANLQLTQQNLQFGDMKNVARQRTGSNIRAFTNVATLPDSDRAPTNLKLATAPVSGGDLRVETGARIATEAGGAVAMSSAKSLYMDGAVSARGGTIDLRINAEGAAVSEDPGQMLWLGAHASLDVSAARTAKFNTLGLIDGNIFDAGSVNLTATRGSVVAAPGSSIDVSGAAYQQDYAVDKSVQHTVVNAAAGAVTFEAADGIVAYGNVKGAAVGDGKGGTLTYKLDAVSRNVVVDNAVEFNSRTISVVDRLPTWDDTIKFGEALPDDFAFKAVVAADNVAKGGFSSLSLIANNLANGTIIGGFGRISFDSDVQMMLRDTLTLGAVNIAVNDHKVDLAAPIIQIGQQLPIGEGGVTAVSQQIDTPAAGTGALSLYANFMELVGNIGVGGTQRVALNSTGDLRLRSPATIDGRFAPSTFSTNGDLAVQASQLYGSTLTDYTFALQGDDSTFTSTGNDAARTPVLSAASKLTVSAPHIDIGGTLLAPLGTLTLNGTKDVRLRSGAVLDVSADNLQIPFGRVQGEDVLWSYLIAANKSPLLIESAPEKTVAITAPVVSMDKGSVINVSGGGDVYGIEQIPGTGGSRDFLDPANSNGAFAVVPWLKSSISPFDIVEMTGFQVDGKAPQIGGIIYLDGANGLPAGNYAILPAHYALLDGAYLVTPKAGSWRPGATATQLDGTTWVSGRYGRAFGGGYDSQWQGFLIEKGEAARTRSEYNIVTSAKFFADKEDVASTGDAGRVVFSVEDQLDLLGSILGAASQNGRRAQLDIIANEIEVVNARDTASTAVQLRASDLNGVGVDSILLGGRRSGTRSEVGIDVGANTVRVRDGATLSVPDIILAARDSVVLDKGAIVSATGASTNTVKMFKVEGDGAFVRASSADQADISRTGFFGQTGMVEVHDGAKIVADYSILIDSSRDMLLDGDITLNARTVGITSLNLTANRISLGDSDDVAAGGVHFTNAKLNSFNAQALRLSSRSSIDFYGDVLLNNRRVELNSGELINHGGVVQMRAADTLQLDNTLNANVTAYDPSEPDDRISGGKLILSAKNLILGNDQQFGELIENPDEHKVRVSGVEKLELGTDGVTSDVTGQGWFTLLTSADVDVVADRVGGRNGATTSIDVRQDTGVITLRRADAGALSIAQSLTDVASRLGARLTLTAKNITQGTHIDLPSGVLTMQATGADAADNVVLAAGSVTDVSGRQLVFPQGSSIASNGGEIHLGSAAGDVVGASGAKVVLGGGGAFDGATLAPVAAGSAGSVSLAGNSGLLGIVAKGKALWQAAIQAAAGTDASGTRAQGGSLELDVGGFDDGAFGGWLQTIADGGIDQRIAIRSRSGDLAIDRQIRAADTTISADSGDVVLAASIDARGGDGGHVALWGGNNLTLGEGARIDASATADGGRGGRVELGARDGALTFGANTALNVAGHVGAAGQDAGRDGSVLLRAPRTASNDDVSVFNQGVKIDGATRIELEAFKSYDATIDGTVASVINDAFSDAQQFMTNTSAQAVLRARFADAAPAGVFHVTPGIDIFSTGDLSLGSNVALSARRYGAIANTFDGEAGVLSLRAAGNLTIDGDLTDGTTSLQTSTANTRLRTYLTKSLMRDFSWDYRLVAGADVAAADPNAVQRLPDATTGNLVVSGGKDIITGAGWINLYAANRVDVQDANSVIAILGRTDFARYTNPTSATGATELLPDTGSIDPYYMTALASKNPDNNVVTFVASRLPFYPKDGGDLNIGGGENVQFAQSTGFFTDWMLRLSNSSQGFGSNTSAQKLPFKTMDVTTWGVLLDSLTAANGGQGVIVLGGGNANVHAGHDVINLNASLPVTARQTGNGAAGANAISIIGGGNLAVTAGNDILSARLWVDRGRLDVTAGGTFGAVAGGMQPMLALADTQVDITARGDVAIGSAFNSTMMPISRKAFTSGTGVMENYFFTYSDDASIDVESLQGDVRFVNNYETVGNRSADGGVSDTWSRTLSGEELRIFAVYPGQLSAVAVNRDIRIENNMTLFPSEIGQLELLAGTDIAAAKDATSTAQIKLNLSDADPAGLPTFNHATKTLFNDAVGADSPVARLIGEVLGLSNPNWHAATPLHAGDDQPAVVAAVGDIGVDGLLTFEVAKPLEAYAGNDIRNISFSLQHSDAAQISEIVAGRDVSFPLIADTTNGTVRDEPRQYIRVSGPGRLDVIAGRDVDLGGSAGIEASANLRNSALPEQGATVSVIAGLNGASALTDPILYGQFADRYFGASNTLSGSYIAWFKSGGFVASTRKSFTTRSNLVSAFTGKSYANDDSALVDYNALPVLTQQAIALEAYQSFVTPDPAYKQPTDLASLQNLGGNLGAALQKVTGQTYASGDYAGAVAGLNPQQLQQVARTLQDASSFTSRLIDYVSNENFGGNLAKAVSAATGQSYANNLQAATALAQLPAAQQQSIARSALDASSPTVRRGLLLDVYAGVVREGGAQQAVAIDQNLSLQSSEGYNRAYAAIEQMFPGKQWKGDIKLSLSGVRTFGDGDINVIAPGGDVDVGLANKIAGIDKGPDQLGIIANGYGEVNGIASGSFNINQSRVFSLDNGDVTLWSTQGDVDAGKGATTALSVQPPKVVFNSDGSSQLVYTTPVAGSGIKVGGLKGRGAADLGPLLLADDEKSGPNGATRRSRIRYVRSLTDGASYLFAPHGAINAGDAGISVAGDAFVAGDKIINAKNFDIGGKSVGVPTTTSISAGTLSLGNTVASAAENATNSMNSAVKDAAASAAGNTAFVTVDIIGVGQ